MFLLVAVPLAFVGSGSGTYRYRPARKPAALEDDILVDWSRGYADAGASGRPTPMLGGDVDVFETPLHVLLLRSLPTY